LTGLPNSLPLSTICSELTMIIGHIIGFFSLLSAFFTPNSALQAAAGSGAVPPTGWQRSVQCEGAPPPFLLRTQTVTSTFAGPERAVVPLPPLPQAATAIRPAIDVASRIRPGRCAR